MICPAALTTLYRTLLENSHYILNIKVRTMLTYNLSSRGSERPAGSTRFIILCIKYSYCYTGFNFFFKMQNLDILNIFSCVRLIVYMLKLDNYQQNKSTHLINSSQDISTRVGYASPSTTIYNRQNKR